MHTKEERARIRRDARLKEKRDWIQKKRTKSCVSTATAQDDIEVFDGPTHSSDEILSEETFDANIRKICQKHGLEVVDVPGIGDCQLHSVIVSHFN